MAKTFDCSMGFVGDLMDLHWLRWLHWLVAQDDLAASETGASNLRPEGVRFSRDFFWRRSNENNGNKLWIIYFCGFGSLTFDPNLWAVERLMNGKEFWFGYVFGDTLPETNSSHLKMDCGKTFSFPFEMAYFRGRAVSFREGKQLF